VATSGASFPSGHAVAASVTAVAAVIALFPEGPGRYAWGAGAAAFSGLMALSRAYLAAHWLSDAVAGVLLGTSCALVMALVVHVIRIRVEGPGGPEAMAARAEARGSPVGGTVP
jgi:undecaprenyl-diphosphatase